MGKAELNKKLHENPNSFELLREYTLVLYDQRDIAGCFALTERAISVYERKALPSIQPQYFELKRLRQRLIREHLDVLVGPSFPLLNMRWLPIFKLGKPREMAWAIDRNNVHLISAALASPQLSRLRYLNINVAEAAGIETLKQLLQRQLSPLRALSLSLNDSLPKQVYLDFFSHAREKVKELITFKLSLPRLDDELAIAAIKNNDKLEYLTLCSLEREALTQNICEFIADNPSSQKLSQLGLVGSSFGDTGLLALLTSEHCTGLQALDLHDGVLSNVAARIVTAENRLSSLRSLDFRYNQIDPAGLDILARTKIDCRCEHQHQRPSSSRDINF